MVQHKLLVMACNINYTVYTKRLLALSVCSPYNIIQRLSETFCGLILYYVIHCLLTVMFYSSLDNTMGTNARMLEDQPFSEIKFQIQEYGKRE